MSTRTQKKSAKSSDRELEGIREAIERYVRENPPAKGTVYRDGPYLVRARILDERFKGRRIGERQDLVWKYLETLPEDIVNELGSLLLLTPHEAKDSYANREFENPVPVGI